MNLDRYQASILTFLFEKLPIGSSVSYLDFPLKGESTERYCIAHARIFAIENSVEVVFTLPRQSNNVALALTDRKTRDVALLLANLQEYEWENGLLLKAGEVVIIPNPDEPAADLPFAVIILPIETSLDCAALPTSKEIAGRLTTFHLVVPLTKAEWAIRKQNGHDALIDHFEATGKALLF